MPTVDTFAPGTLAETMSGLQEELACSDCAAEVRVTAGVKLFRARVIHAAGCPWFARYLAKQVAGRIPCCTVVTHRGPYVRDPEAGIAE